MDIQQLKLLGGRLRVLLQQSNHPVGHNQSLDLIAALPGLRNWPEVMAFPERVDACELDLAATGRLSFRLKKKFDLDRTPQALLVDLTPAGVPKRKQVPQIWPGGPAPGVYITTSQSAIDALLTHYEEATDGALVYAERAGNGGENAIDLGENGLWSNGLSRVPSGTLIVVGPLELDQQSWDDSARRLEMACLKALVGDLRVAVLLDTPTPETMCEDTLLMVQRVQPDGDDCDTALVGVVTEDGELEIKEPFARAWPPAVQLSGAGSDHAIPSVARAPLQEVLARHSTGIMIFGSAVIAEHAALDMVASALALTEHLGPAARVMPRHRSTPSKDWDVPEPIQQLPFLPSVESAYAQGYRRIVLNPNYTSTETLLEYGGRALLIANSFGVSSIDECFIRLRVAGVRRESEVLALILAMLAVTSVSARDGLITVCDMYVADPRLPAVEQREYEELYAYLLENRCLKHEDQLNALLDSNGMSEAELREALPARNSLREFMSTRFGKKA